METNQKMDQVIDLVKMIGCIYSEEFWQTFAISKELRPHM